MYSIYTERLNFRNDYIFFVNMEVTFVGATDMNIQEIRAISNFLTKQNAFVRILAINEDNSDQPNVYTGHISAIVKDSLYINNFQIQLSDILDIQDVRSADTFTGYIPLPYAYRPGVPYPNISGANGAYGNTYNTYNISNNGSGNISTVAAQQLQSNHIQANIIAQINIGKTIEDFTQVYKATQSQRNLSQEEAACFQEDLRLLSALRLSLPVDDVEDINLIEEKEEQQKKQDEFLQQLTEASVFSGALKEDEMSPYPFDQSLLERLTDRNQRQLTTAVRLHEMTGTIIRAGISINDWAPVVGAPFAKVFEQQLRDFMWPAFQAHPQLCEHFCKIGAKKSTIKETPADITTIRNYSYILKKEDGISYLVREDVSDSDWQNLNTKIEQIGKLRNSASHTGGAFGEKELDKILELMFKQKALEEVLQFCVISKPSVEYDSEKKKNEEKETANSSQLAHLDPNASEPNLKIGDTGSFIVEKVTNRHRLLGLFQGKYRARTLRHKELTGYLINSKDVQGLTLTGKIVGFETANVCLVDLAPDSLNMVQKISLRPLASDYGINIKELWLPVEDLLHSESVFIAECLIGQSWYGRIEGHYPACIMEKEIRKLYPYNIKEVPIPCMVSEISAHIGISMYKCTLIKEQKAVNRSKTDQADQINRENEQNDTIKDEVGNEAETKEVGEKSQSEDPEKLEQNTKDALAKCAESGSDVCTNVEKSDVNEDILQPDCLWQAHLSLDKKFIDIAYLSPEQVTRDDIYTEVIFVGSYLTKEHVVGMVNSYPVRIRGYNLIINCGLKISDNPNISKKQQQRNVLFTILNKPIRCIVRNNDHIFAQCKQNASKTTDPKKTTVSQASNVAEDALVLHPEYPVVNPNGFVKQYRGKAYVGRIIEFYYHKPSVSEKKEFFARWGLDIEDNNTIFVGSDFSGFDAYSTDLSVTSDHGLVPCRCIACHYDKTGKCSYPLLELKALVPSQGMEMLDYIYALGQNSKQYTINEKLRELISNPPVGDNKAFESVLYYVLSFNGMFCLDDFPLSEDQRKCVVFGVYLLQAFQSQAPVFMYDYKLVQLISILVNDHIARGMRENHSEVKGKNYIVATRLGAEFKDEFSVRWPADYMFFYRSDMNYWEKWKLLFECSNGAYKEQIKMQKDTEQGTPINN